MSLNTLGASDLQSTDPAPAVGRGGRGPRRAVISWTFVALVVLVAVLAPWLPLADPATQDLSTSLDGPSAAHPLGNDVLGRDALARLVYGARTTFAAAALAVLVTVALGLPTGLIAGYVRGPVDAVMSRLADAVMAVPPLILLLAAIAALGQGLGKSMVVLGVILAPRLFRVVRAATLSLSGSGFLELGRLSGCPPLRILGHYVLSNVRTQVAVQVSLLFGYAVLTEASISFLGLGVQPPDPSLGLLLKESVEYMSTAPLLTIAPGILITGFILACNLIGDAYTTESEAR